MQLETISSHLKTARKRINFMKLSGNNTEKVLSLEEFKALFDRGFDNERDRALFGLIFYCNCPIVIALNVTVVDIQGDRIILRNMQNRPYKTIALHPDLKQLLDDYLKIYPVESLLFPKMNGAAKHPQKILPATEAILEQAGERVGLAELSLLSFHRTALRRSSYYRLDIDKVVS
jgi:integrase/recombinase XerD